MLQAMRDGAHSGIIKFVLFGLLILGVAGLVFSSIGNYFTGGVGSSDVARVGDRSISLQSFDRNVRGILRRQGMDVDQAYRLGYIDQILVGEVQSILLNREAVDLGIKIADEHVAEKISRLVAPLIDDETKPQQALERILATQGISEQQFVNSIRQEMTNTLIRDALQSGSSFVPAFAAKDLYLFDNQTRRIKYFLIKENDFQDIENPGTGELKEFFETMKESYAIPERRTLSVAVIDPETISSNIAIPEEDIRQIYEENIEYYTSPEKRKMAQAIVDDRETARRIYEKAIAGKPLQTAIVDATGSSEKYFDVKAFEKDGLIENIANEVFSIGEGGISEPVQTPLGWHVVKVTEIVPPAKTPFEEVRDEIREEYMQTALADQLYELAGEVDDLIAGGASLEEAVEIYDLEVSTIEMTDLSGSGPEGQDALSEFSEDKPLIIETGFSLMEGEISPVVEFSNGSFSVIRADKIVPRSWPEFGEIREDLTKKWISRERKLRVMQAADNVLAKLEGGATLEETAKSRDAVIKTVTLARNAEPGEIFNPGARMKFFSLDQGEAGTAATENGMIIGEVAEISIPEENEITDEELDTYARTIERTMSNELLQAYIGYLTEKYEVKINRRLLDRIYKPDSEE